jgi:hypothetical protein
MPVAEALNQCVCGEQADAESMTSLVRSAFGPHMEPREISLCSVMMLSRQISYKPVLPHSTMPPISTE